jgi:hypothetical protein
MRSLIPGANSLQPNSFTPATVTVEQHLASLDALIRDAEAVLQ